MRPNLSWIILFFVPLAGGCMQRTLTVRSNPSEALVFMNDQEVGRTPFTRSFTWYGTYEIELRKEGYQSVKTTAMVWAPWWQWVPFDLFTELLPIEDHHELKFTLHEPSAIQVEPYDLLQRGVDLRSQLQSSERPTTQPVKPPKRVKRT